MSPVDELRSAAVLLRQRATAATPGPWRYDPDILDNGSIVSDSPEVNPGWGCLVSEQASTRDPDSKWIATVDPLVGLALADVIADLAHAYAGQSPEMVELMLGGVAGAEHRVGPAHPVLRLARLINGGGS